VGLTDVAEVLPLHLADVDFPAGHPQAGESGPILGFAVVHDAGVLLFDTGVGTGNAEVEEYFRPRVTPLGEALGAHGLSVDDVTAVANSHLHFDHCGQNTLLPGRTVYVQAPELAAAREPDYTVPEWIGLGVVELVELDGGATEVAPGLTIVPTPGHTAGHQSLLVRTEAGPVLLAGQAVYTAAEWDGSTDPRRSGFPSALDPRAYAASVRRLRALDPVRVHFAHDLEAWNLPTPDR